MSDMPKMTDAELIVRAKAVHEQMCADVSGVDITYCAIVKDLIEALAEHVRCDVIDARDGQQCLMPYGHDGVHQVF